MSQFTGPSAQMPGSPPPQVPQGHGAPPAGKGFPWGKVLAGCGCLMFLGVIAVGIVGFFAYRAVDDLKDDFGFITQLNEGSQTAKKGAKKGASTSPTSSSSGKGVLGIEDPKKAHERALESATIRNYIEAPLTRAEVREFNKFTDDWRKNPAFVRWEKETQGLKTQSEKNKGKDLSVAEQLRAVRQAGRTVTAMTELIEAFDEHVQKNGGYEKHYSRTMRISGLHLAAETMSSKNKKLDIHSDEISKLMLKERPEIAREYQAALKDARETAARAKTDDQKSMAAYQAMTSMMAGGPGTMALGRMPAQSFQTWDALSPAQRKELSENLTTVFGAASWFGMGMPPGVLFMAAFRAELEEFGR